METQATQPFAVPEFSPVRVRLWATFARQASRGEEMSMVSWAFLAFWWELQMASSFERVVPNVEAGWIADAVGWLNLLVQETGHALWQWREVLRQMASQEALPAHYRECFEDAQQQVARLSALLPQIGAYGLMLCSQYDLLIPPDLQQAVMVEAAAS